MGSWALLAEEGGGWQAVSFRGRYGFREDVGGRDDGATSLILIFTLLLSLAFIHHALKDVVLSYYIVLPRIFSCIACCSEEVLLQGRRPAPSV
jgi:hypothetical protein